MSQEKSQEGEVSPQEQEAIGRILDLVRRRNLLISQCREGNKSIAEKERLTQEALVITFGGIQESDDKRNLSIAPDANSIIALMVKHIDLNKYISEPHIEVGDSNANQEGRISWKNLRIDVPEMSSLITRKGHKRKRSVDSGKEKEVADIKVDSPAHVILLKEIMDRNSKCQNLFYPSYNAEINCAKALQKYIELREHEKNAEEINKEYSGEVVDNRIFITKGNKNTRHTDRDQFFYGRYGGQEAPVPNYKQRNSAVAQKCLLFFLDVTSQIKNYLIRTSGCNFMQNSTNSIC